MLNWRIQTNFIDKSQAVAPSAGSFGAMVIRASKGPKIPTLIQRGQTQDIIDLFGEPSASFPDVQEAINFNGESAMWLASPYLATDTHSAALITNASSIGVAGGLTDAEIGSYSFSASTQNVANTVTTIVNTATREYNYTLSHVPVTPTTMIIKRNGVALAGLSITGSAPNYTVEASGILETSTYNSTTRLLHLDFVDGYSLSANDVITIEYTTSATALMLLYAKSPSSDDTAIKASYNSTSGIISVEVYRYDDSTSPASYSLITTYELSPIPGKKDGFGKVIYAPEVIDENDKYLGVVVNGSIDAWIASPSFVDDSSYVLLSGGSRDTSSIAASDVVSVWDNFQNSNLYPAKVFMSTMHDSTIVARFNTLATSYQIYSVYLIPSVQTDDPDEYIVTKNALGINNSSLVFFHNYFLMKSNYIPQGVYSSMIGAIGTKYARIIQNRKFYAPAGIDENGYGGDIGGYGATKALYDYSDTQLQALDNAGINPVIYNTNTIMIAGDKTGQNPSIYTDKSFVPHDLCFKYIIETTINNVLGNQLFKLNDALHRDRVATQARRILEPLVGDGFISEYAVKCDSSNNNATILSQRKFVLSVAVKVTPFSEFIVFNFVATAQGVDVQAQL